MQFFWGDKGGGKRAGAGIPVPCPAPLPLLTWKEQGASKEPIS